MPVAVGPERLVNTVTDGAQRPGDVATGIATGAVWIDSSSGLGVAKLRTYERDGSPISGEVTVGSATDVAVASIPGGFVVVRVVQIGPQQVDIVAQTYNPTGQPNGAALTIDSVDVRNSPVLGYSSRGLDATPLSDGGYAVGWSSSSASSGGTVSVSAEYAVVSAQGAIEGSGVLTSISGRSVTGNDTEVAFTQLPGGQVLVTFKLYDAIFDDGNPPFTAQFAQILDAAGGTLRPGFQLEPGLPADGGPRLDGANGMAVEALANGKVAFAWFSNGQMYMSLYDGDRLLQGDASVRTAPVSLPGATGGEPQIVELADGRFVVGYAANEDVWAQVFLPSGQPEGARFRLNTELQGPQDELRLSVSRDGVVAALWEDPGGTSDPSGSGVKLQLVSYGLSQTGGPGRDTLTGGPTEDVLSGLAGDDVLIGQGGADTLLGGMGGDSFLAGAGDDRIDGDSNTDFISYGDATSAVVVDLTAGTATGGGGSDTLISVEAVYGSLHNDHLTGNYLSNLILGELGNDTVVGQAGANYLDGGQGNDLIELVGQVTDYFVTNVTATGARVIGPYGVDQVLNFERVRIGTTEMSWQDFTSQAFNGLRYIASNPDLIASLGADAERGRQHWLNTGRAEGRSLDAFDPLRYAASNPDIAAQLYIDTAALSRHFILTGFAAGRSATSFDPLQYAAINPDLLRAFGVDAAAFTRHYAVAGVAENRPLTGFDPLLYGATNDDLARVFGNDANALFQHWINSGVFEGREPSGFDAVAYVLSYPELQAASVTPQNAVNHWLTVGADQGLRGDELFGREQTTHEILSGVARGTLANFTTSGRFSADRDWYEVRLNSVDTYRFTALGVDSGRGTLGDPRIEIYDARGRLVASDEDGGAGRDASLDFRADHGGGARLATYYVVVRSTPGDEGTYDVTFDLARLASPADGWVT